MWFKNLYLFKFEKDFTLNAEELHDELLKKPFTPCSATQRESLGWVAPIGNGESMTHSSSKNILISMARQERILPAAVVKEALQENQVASAIYYPIPLHKQEAINGLLTSTPHCPNAESLSEQCMSLPIYPELDNASIERIASVIEDALKVAA